ncbi:integrase arm-type DNA-binding domain-containing protein [Oleiagrimonas sp.]|jgi:integrase|uniref:tyrosine-type recombinase/integrase n=1 Tax=Oleiagrimonas sp. TaxID=2010330 RepID=UPI0026294A53|nr:integrase arm-type DNA-binding domain-containing protein [Oleiagrimonas sp.]MDA3914732.1 tyrosine-type recombinase/integrase [Oleiagrimonas sp.]
MLTDSKLKALRSRATLYRVADGQGLCVEVPIAGAKRWRFRYRYNGAARMLSLGVYPDVSLLSARKRRDEARQLLGQGVDPSAERKASKEATGLTFAIVATEWLERRDVAPATAAKDHWLVNKLAIPALGHRPIAEITSAEVLALLQQFERADKLETAARLKVKLSAVFRYAIATGRASNDPTIALRGAIKSVKVKHHAAITDPRKLGELLRAAHAYGGSFAVACALKLSPLVFVRPGELRHAEWSEIDMGAAEWRIPASKMKMRAEHIVPLSPQSLAILRELYALTGRGRYVFPSPRTPTRPMSENALTAALRALGYDGDTMTAHGFRGTASTLLHEMGYPSDVIERQLAHKESNAVKEAYNRAQHLPERRKMMTAWADYLDGLRMGADVIPVGHRVGMDA